MILIAYLSVAVIAGVSLAAVGLWCWLTIRELVLGSPQQRRGGGERLARRRGDAMPRPWMAEGIDRAVSVARACIAADVLDWARRDEGEVATNMVRGAFGTAVGVDGVKVLDCTSGAEASASVAYLEVPPGASRSMACSQCSERYCVVARGRIEFSIGDSRVTLGEGEFCRIPQGNVLGYRNAGDGAAALVLVRVSGRRREFSRAGAPRVPS